MEEIGLKPCPLCGNIECIEVWRNFIYWHVTCNRCNLNLTSKSPYRKNAINKWNYRYSEQKGPY